MSYVYINNALVFNDISFKDKFAYLCFVLLFVSQLNIMLASIVMVLGELILNIFGP